MNETYYNTSTATAFGGVGLTNVNRSDFAMSFTHAFLEDGTPISGAIVGPSGPSTFDGVSAQQPTTNTTHSHALVVLIVIWDGTICFGGCE